MKDYMPLFAAAFTLALSYLCGSAVEESFDIRNWSANTRENVFKIGLIAAFTIGVMVLGALSETNDEKQ